MSIHVPQNFYRETITRAVTLTTGVNIYVSAHPTPAEGYVAISPASSNLREIVYYTAKGTDGNGTYLTITTANRGLGGTTAQTHAIGEPVRMNVSAETIQEVSDALDQIVAGGAQDASTTTKGISKLSVAPASATNPIAVGDNDTRVPTAIISTSAGSGDSGKVPKLNGSGVLDTSFLSFKGAVYTGQTTYNLATATGTQNIAHGLGVVPKFARLRVRYISASVSWDCEALISSGSASYLSVGQGNGTATTNTVDTTRIYIDTTGGGDDQRGLLTTDATNIIISWTKQSSPTGTAYIICEAIA
jgi:hypothetical protein